MVLPGRGLGLGDWVKLHWGHGKQRWKKGDTLRWLTMCGKWLPLHGFAPRGKAVTCKTCRARMIKK